MANQTSVVHRAPAPITAAAALFAVTWLVSIAVNLGQSLGWEWGHGSDGGSIATSVVAASIGAAIGAVATVGLMRGWRGARIAVVVLSALGGLAAMTQLNAAGLLRMTIGALVIALMVIPASSRGWFSRS